MYGYGRRDSQAAHDNDPAQHGSHVLGVLDERGCENSPSVPPVQAQRRHQPWESVPAKKKEVRVEKKTENEVRVIACVFEEASVSIWTNAHFRPSPTRGVPSMQSSFFKTNHPKTMKKA
jgi:hypothetical protein